MGIFAGYLFLAFSMDMSLRIYFQAVAQAILLRDVAFMLVKSVLFAIEFVQQRIHAAARDNRFFLAVTESAREFLVAAGTDVRYGARPLKRAIERLLVHPLSNLMASRQIRGGDYIRVSHPQDAPSLLFSRETQAEQAWGAARQPA